MSGAGLAEPVVSLSEAQAYVRIETGEEEAVLAGLIRTASAVCESFINQVVIAREFAVDLPASAAWSQIAGYRCGLFPASSWLMRRVFRRLCPRGAESGSSANHAGHSVTQAYPAQPTDARCQPQPPGGAGLVGIRLGRRRRSARAPSGIGSLYRDRRRLLHCNYTSGGSHPFGQYGRNDWPSGNHRRSTRGLRRVPALDRHHRSLGRSDRFVRPLIPGCFHFADAAGRDPERRERKGRDDEQREHAGRQTACQRRYLP